MHPGKREELAQETSGSKQTGADPPEVLERFHSGLELVAIIANKLSRTMPKALERDDLLSAGREGLLDAARRFDAAHGASFNTYASLRIRGSMLDAMRQLSALPRYEYYRVTALQAAAEFSEGEWPKGAGQTARAGALAAGAGAVAEKSFDERLESMAVAAAVRLRVTVEQEQEADAEQEFGQNPEEAVGKAELLYRIRREIDVMVEERELPVDEREILQRHYFDGTSITDIARDMGLDKSWVSRQHTRAIARLTERLRSLDFI
jgi:RNA polymerase sigma factor FliA